MTPRSTSPGLSSRLRSCRRSTRGGCPRGQRRRATLCSVGSIAPGASRRREGRTSALAIMGGESHQLRGGRAGRLTAMTHQDEQNRPEPPLAGDDRHPPGLPERQRATLAWKCGGLDAAGLRVTVAASSITLGGLLKHLALVEDHTFSLKWFGREDPGPPWNRADWDADPDWDWHSAAEDTPPSSSMRSGRTPWPAPAPWSRRLWTTAAFHRRNSRVPTHSVRFRA